MAAMARIKPGGKSLFLVCYVSEGAQTLGPSSTASLDTPAGRWNGRGGAHTAYQHWRWQFNLTHHSSSPRSWHFLQLLLTITLSLTWAHGDCLPQSKCCACWDSKNEQIFKNKQALPPPTVQWERKKLQICEMSYEEVWAMCLARIFYWCLKVRKIKWPSHKARGNLSRSTAKFKSGNWQLLFPPSNWTAIVFFWFL